MAFVQVLLFESNVEEQDLATHPNDIYVLFPPASQTKKILQLFRNNHIIVLGKDTRYPELTSAIKENRACVVEMFFDTTVQTAQHPGDEFSFRAYVDNKNKTSVQKMFNQNLDIRTVSTKSSFRWTTDSDSVDIFNELLTHGTEIHVKEKGFILHLAVRRDDTVLTQLLLKHGANIDIKGLNGATALHMAVNCNHWRIIKILLEHGCNVNETNNRGDTPLFLAKEEILMCETLLNHGADVSKRRVKAPNEDATPLHLAAESGSVEVCHSILEHGANVNALCDWRLLKFTSVSKLHVRGFTPLHASVSSANDEPALVRLLLQYGADVNAKEQSSGLTALHIAVDREFLESVEILVKNGADVTAKDLNGSTPLGEAFKGAHFEIIKFLYNFGAGSNDFYEVVKALSDQYESQYSIGYEKLAERIQYLLDHNFTADFNVDDTVYARLGKMPVSVSLLFLEHRIKIESAGLVVDCDSSRLEQETAVQCKQELRHLKVARVGDTPWTFHDVLMGGVDCVASFARNSAFPRLLDPDLKSKLPNYGNILALQLEKGCLRRELVDQASEKFHILFRKLEFPTELAEHILAYLCNQDILVLINVLTRLP